MGWQDRLRESVSSALGGALGYMGGLAFDTFAKAAQAAPGAKNDGHLNNPPDMPDPADQGAKALLYDPFSVIDQLGFKDRPSGMTYAMLEDIHRKVPVVSAIIQTRVNQVANFCIPQLNDREPGYQIKLRDEEKSPTKKEMVRAKAIEDWLRYTGSTRAYGKDSLESFVRKLIRDSLVYDQGCFEVVDNRKGEPSDFYAVDASTIRLADIPTAAEPSDDPKRVRYVQVYDDVVIAEFAASELCFGVRNPRTGIRLNGYGMSEIEMLIRTVTAMLWAFEYNARFFSQGSVTKGLINIKGAIPDTKLEAFRRQWYQQIAGVANAWRTPVINAEDLQYINLHSSNRDMEFSAFLDWLIKIASAVYQIDPSEINFLFGNTGQQQQMFQAPAEGRIKSSKDRGLRPLLRALGEWLNRYLIWRIDEDYQIVFTGLDMRSGAEIADLQKKQSTYLKTVDEIRAEDDLPPLPDGKGECILDPTWLQFSQAKEMAAQQQQMGPAGAEGAAPEEGEGEQPPESEGGQPPGDEGQEEGQPGPWDEMLSQFDEFPGTEGEPEEEQKKSMRHRRTYRIEV
ncbi:MAG: phage portal protein [Planctomycetes bacterium]|jgi:hypothetical protein|nr:phage portal protein [Planctomycetota bacterium]